MKRQNIASGTKWENIAGYSRAVRVGNYVYVAGTTSVDEQGQIVGENDPYAQAAFIFQKIERALKEAGADLTSVVRTRMFVTDMHTNDAVLKAHSECFDAIRPAATLVAVSELIDPRLLVEIEVDAVIIEVG